MEFNFSLERHFFLDACIQIDRKWNLAAVYYCLLLNEKKAISLLTWMLCDEGHLLITVRRLISWKEKKRLFFYAQAVVLDLLALET